MTADGLLPNEKETWNAPEPTLLKDQDWHKARAKVIGGSEIASVLGIDEYKSPYQVWLDKTGRTKGTSIDNAFTRAGRKLEHIVAEYFAEETKYEIQVNDGNKIEHVRHADLEFVGGSRDYFYIKDGKKCVLECKTTQKYIDIENMPLSWVLQVNYYMGLYGLERGAIAWLERGYKFNFVEYEFNKELFDYVIEQVSEFWNKYVLADVEPEPSSANDLRKKYPNHVTGKTVEAVDETLHLVEQLSNEKIKLSEMAESIEKKETSLKMILKDAEALVYGDRLLATYKKAKDGEKFDTKKFVEDHPELAKKYMQPKAGARTLMIKI